MTNSLDSFSKTDPFAAAISLQEEHARAYSELADQIRPESPEAASILLTMRQRQQSELRKLMCVYGFLSSERPSTIPHSARVVGDEEKASKGSLVTSSYDRELKRRIFVLQIVQPGLAGLNGWFRVHAGTSFRSRLCHPQFSHSFPRWDGSFARRRNQYGICRSPFRRWSPQRQRSTLDARRSLWHDDDFGWDRPYFAISVTGFYGRSLAGGGSGGNRVRCHFLDQKALHGYAVAAGRFSGGVRGYSRISNWHFDWEPLISG